MARHNYNQAQLQGLLNGWVGAQNLEFAVVVDVGQGNLNVLCDNQGRPYLYFDLGGGILGSTFTYPQPRPTLCYTPVGGHLPRFMLSHWDGDHYRTAIEEHAAGNLANTHWLAPLQVRYVAGCRLSLSTQAKGLRTDLAAAGDVYLWPDHTAVLQITSGRHRFIKVTGSDMNNHGLALRVENPNPAVAGTAEYMLFTGDSTFETGTLAHNADQHTVALIAGHHGAEVDDGMEIPRPLNTGLYAISYSYGSGNHYGHPSTTGVDEYDGRDWDTHPLTALDVRTDTAGGEGDADYAGSRGNTGMLWSVPDTAPWKLPAAPTHLEVNGAAIALLATGAAELRLFANGIAGGAASAVIVGAAHKAASEAVQPGGGLVAAALVNPANAGPPPPPHQTLLQIATGMGAPEATLNAALASLPGTANGAADAQVVALADAIALAVLTAAAHMQRGVTHHAKTNCGGGRIGSQARAATNLAYAFATTLGNQAASGAHPADARIDDVRNAAHALAAAGSPNNVAIRAAIGQAVGEAFARCLGHVPAGAASVHARRPPDCAEDIVLALAPIRHDVSAGIAAAAAVAPMPAVNPEAGIPAAAPAVGVYARKAARVVALAAIVGQRAGAPPADAARVGVAVGRVVFQAALGAPQLGCHRHPATCAGGPCHLSIHYSPLPLV